MPVLQPAELWRRSGRYAIEALFKLHDRKGAELVLAMTHEEAVTTHVAQLVRSYRDLPLILYHVQVKERDEPRPRAGVLRTREFVMKDSYTFDRDAEGLEERYQLHVGAYDRIMERTGLRYYRVEADVGMMGGLGAHEYMAPCAGGRERGRARGRLRREHRDRERRSPARRAADGAATRRSPSPRRASPRSPTWRALLGLPEGALMKAYPVLAADGEGGGERIAARAGARRPSRQRDQARQRARRSSRASPAASRSRARSARPASSARSGSARRSRSCSTRPCCTASATAATSTGANRPDAHLRGVVPGRDFEFREVDVRIVCAGRHDRGAGRSRSSPRSRWATSSSSARASREPLGATYLDEQGREQLIWMGSYGIGPARIVAAAVEQYADEHGISWPRALAPFAVHLVSLGKAGTPEREACERVYSTLLDGGVEVLYDDRDVGPGEKFADAELLGLPAAPDGGAAFARVGRDRGAGAARARSNGSGLELEAEPAQLLSAVEQLWQALP